MQSPAGGLVETVHVPVALGAPPQGRGDPQHRPAVGPLPLPWVLLALLAVDLLEGEEAPLHIDVPDLLDLPDPFAGLVRPRAHDVEMEIDSGHIPHSLRSTAVDARWT